MSIPFTGLSETPVCDPREVGIDPRGLEAALEELRCNSGRDGIGRTVVARHGRVVYAGREADQQQMIWSCTKSIVSATLGLLVDEGRVALDQPVSDVLPALRPHYPDATFRHFASMTSGYRAIGDDAPDARWPHYRHGPSATPFDPHPQPVHRPAGSAYAYWDSAVNVLALAMTRVARQPLVDLFRRRIGDPIGMRLRWGGWDVDGVEVCGGAGNHGGNIRTSALDLARFGQLMLQRGRWNQTSLLSEMWCAQATRVQAPADLPSTGGFADDGPGHYGLLWWVNAADARSTRRWDGIEPAAFAASGYNNNDLFVLPGLRIVVVRLGLDQDTDGPIPESIYARVLRLLCQAIE